MILTHLGSIVWPTAHGNAQLALQSNEFLGHKFALPKYDIRNTRLVRL